MSFLKHSAVVVGGHYVKITTPLTGLLWCVYYGKSKMLASQYGVKPPDWVTRFMTGTAMLMAGSVAFDVYDFNKDISRLGDMEMKELNKELAKMRKMRARKLPKPLALFEIACYMFMVGDLYSMTTQMKSILDNKFEKVSVSD